MIGSSNFTRAGMGTAVHRNAEANLVTVVQRVAYGRKKGRLEDIWSQMGPDVDLEAAEWLGPQPEHDIAFGVGRASSRSFAPTFSVRSGAGRRSSGDCEG